MCEGQMVPHAHKEDAVEYQLFDKEGNKDHKAYLCSECALTDIKRGYDWKVVSGQFVPIAHYRDTVFDGFHWIENPVQFYPNEEDECTK
jgi:hypothetical protein